MRLLAPAPFLLGLLLGACGSGDKPAATAAETPPPPQKTVIDTQLKALDKAKAVQGVVDDQKDKTDQALQDAGG